jgi:hypothetical protein
LSPWDTGGSAPVVPNAAIHCAVSAKCDGFTRRRRNVVFFLREGIRDILSFLRQGKNQNTFLDNSLQLAAGRFIRTSR